MTKKTTAKVSVSLILSAVLMLSGCGGTKTPTTATGSSQPRSQISGYYASDQSVSGGKELKFINLRDIKVDKVQADTRVTLEFKDGSLQMGMVEKATEGVPLYSTQWIDGIDRLVLSINGLIYWDYKIFEEELEDTPILGIFKQVPVNEVDTTKLYINLKDDIAYRIEEQGNKLVLYLRAVPEDEREDYYVLFNAFEEYTYGEISDEEGLLPTLCSDRTNVMLISKPFATEEEANTFLSQKETSLLKNFPGKSAVVKKLKNNSLPEYDAKGALNELANTPVIRRGGVESAAPVLIATGNILCWSPDGISYVYSTPFFLGSDNGGEATMYEKLYMSESGSNTPKLLTEFEYSGILKAQFSDDGRYLAFLDQSESKRTLYIYDTTDAQVFTAAESGFGVDTADFSWGSGDQGHTIYALTGEKEMLQLMSYSLQSEEPHVETLVENDFSEGSVCYYDGKVYYSQTSDDAGQSGVFTFDPATRITNRLCPGAFFEMSRKTGNMAILNDMSGGQETLSYILKLYNPKTLSDKVLAEDEQVAQIVWSNDGSTLYYTIYQDDVDNGGYNETLYQYNTLSASGESAEICEVKEGRLSPADKSSEILLSRIYAQENQSVRLTYIISATDQAK